MATAADNITDLAQDWWFTVNGSEKNAVGTALVKFQNQFIRGFNLWKQEYETETYWNNLRVDDYVLTTIFDTNTYSWELDEDYRTPVFDPNKELKFVLDGTIIARFKLVNPNQLQVDDSLDNPNRATFVGRNIVLSRAPTEEEVGSQILLDVVSYLPDLTIKDDTALGLIYNRQIAVLGVAKNTTLPDTVKGPLSPNFTQKYKDELNKALNANMASNAIDDMRRDDYSNITGIW